ncbi:MAG: hypothetical protein HFJ85_01780 [Oscillospiraceae bacterium]|nr:hypothetical protein [Oscillospiraceae bacterium]
MLPDSALYRVVKEFFPTAFNDYKNSYEKRLQVQKLVYIFETAYGKSLYGFSWYLAGPYSSILTHQIYDTLLAETEQYSQWDRLTFSDKVVGLIQKIKNVYHEAEKYDTKCDATRLWELLASLLYLRENMDLSKEKDPAEILKNKILANKPHFKDTPHLNEIINLILEF